jgi:glycosyltransferase involved in cell wall biosynthesis
MQRSVDGINPGFVLCVSRLLAYKNVDAVIDAFAELSDNRLVVVGTGPEERRLSETAGSNVSMVGRVEDDQLAWLYSNCAGVVAASREDFGLTPLEAASCGKPVAALRGGGYLETVLEGRTGVFFDEPDPPSIASAVRGLLSHPWDVASIEEHAKSYVESFFAGRLRAVVGTTIGDDPVPANWVAA